MTGHGRALLTAAVGILGLAACSTPRAEPPPNVVLINLSGLRADGVEAGLGSPEPAGSEPGPELSSEASSTEGPRTRAVQAPRLEGLAARGAVFTNVWATSSNPWIAQASLRSGLLPSEHGVTSLDHALSDQAPVLAELFAAAGYRTAAFAEGGAVARALGADRGFDHFESSLPEREGEGLGVFEAGLEFARAGGEAPFFLYLQSNRLKRFDWGAPGGSGEGRVLTAIDLARVNGGHEPLTPALAKRARRIYRHAVSEADRSLGLLLDGLDEAGLLDRTVVAVTADRGSELGEHGKLGQQQLYPEVLRVPVVVAGPGVGAAHSAALGQVVDLAPSLLDLAGVRRPAMTAWPLPGLGSAGATRDRALAIARERQAQGTLLVERAGRKLQLVVSRLRGEYDGTWVTREIQFDTEAGELEFEMAGYAELRDISISVDGREVATIVAGPDWSEERVALGPPGTRRRIRFATRSCRSPAEFGSTLDERCLSFKLRGLELGRTELFDVSVDPGARSDLSLAEPELTDELVRELEEDQPRLVARPMPVTLPLSVLTDLERLRELPEPPG